MPEIQRPFTVVPTLDTPPNGGHSEKVLQNRCQTKNQANRKTFQNPRSNDAAKTAPPAASPPEHRSRLQKLIPWLILLVAAGILFVIIAGWNRWAGGGTVKTDDAYLHADITPLSTKVSATVQQVVVDDYQHVKAGDLLVQLKDDDFKAQAAQAEANVAAAEAALENYAKQKELQGAKIMAADAALEGARAEMRQAEAAVEAAKSDVANAQAALDQARAKITDAQAAIDAAAAHAQQSLLERKRQEALVNEGSATRQNLEQVVTTQEQSAANLNSRKAELAQAHAAVESRRPNWRRPGLNCRCDRRSDNAPLRRYPANLQTSTRRRSRPQCWTPRKCKQRPILAQSRARFRSRR